MTTQFNSNDRQLSRVKIAAQSKIPKPKVVASSSIVSSFPVHLANTDISSETNSPAAALNNNAKLNLDLLLDSGLKAQMDTATGEEHSWLIGADRGSDVDDLLNQLEFEECIDVEGPLPIHYVPSDIESQGSHDGEGIEEEDNHNNLEEESSNQQRGYLQAFVGKLCSMAKTLEWLKAQPFSFTPETPLGRSRNTRSNEKNAHSGAASSCKSSRSLSAAFDLAAIEPSVFRFTERAPAAAVGGGQNVLEAEMPSSSCCFSRLDEIQFTHYIPGEEEEYDDYLSACSDCAEEEVSLPAATATAASPGGRVSVSSKSSAADSDEIHQSLLINTSLGVSGVDDWLSNGRY